MAANYQKYLKIYLDSLKLELIKYYKSIQQISKINCKTFFTAENLLSIKEKVALDAKNVFDGVVWSEKFITIICMIHALILVNILQDRKSIIKQTLYACCLIILSFSSTFLNNLGSENWKKFATKNYFDSNGKFMLFFLNIPVFIEGLICFVNIILLSICCSNSKDSTTSKKSKQKAKKPVPKNQPNNGSNSPKKSPVEGGSRSPSKSPSKSPKKSPKKSPVKKIN